MVDTDPQRSAATLPGVSSPPHPGGQPPPAARTARRGGERPQSNANGHFISKFDLHFLPSPSHFPLGQICAQGGEEKTLVSVNFDSNSSLLHSLDCSPEA